MIFSLRSFFFIPSFCHPEELATKDLLCIHLMKAALLDGSFASLRMTREEELWMTRKKIICVNL